MCGRYALMTPARELAARFGVSGELLEFAPRYNLAPLQEAPIVRMSRARDVGDTEAAAGSAGEGLGEGAQRVLRLARWGLVPPWAEDTSIASHLINARCEGIESKPAFRKALTVRRCVVPADGFYEWQKVTSRVKQPYFIRRADGVPLAFAGLHESWRDKGGGADAPWLATFTIITTAANTFMQKVHDRMPVVLEPESIAGWLDPQAPVPQLQDLLRPAPDGVLTMHAVGTKVGNFRNDTPDLVRAVDERQSLF